MEGQTHYIPNSPPTGFARVDAMMIQARAKYAANPALVSKIRADATSKAPKLLPPTPESLDFDERVDRAIAKSCGLLAEAQAQLNAPVSDFLPAELTPSELAEQADAEKWAEGSQLADRTTDRMLEGSQALLDEVMGLTDELQDSGIDVPGDATLPSPPSTPALEWLNVPQQVKTWVSESKKPFVEYREPSSFSTYRASSSITPEKQLFAISADLASTLR